MVAIKKRFLFSIALMIGLAGCFPESFNYRTVTDGLDKKEYIVVGRVRDSGNRPIANCRVFLTRQKPVMEPQFRTNNETMNVKVSPARQNAEMEPIPVALTDHGGNYNLIFELAGATQFWLHFDARDQGYPIRYENFSHLLESSLFQYTGNNPVIVNVIIDKKPILHQPAGGPGHVGN
jgi:hypothetical protein